MTFKLHDRGQLCHQQSNHEASHHSMKSRSDSPIGVEIFIQMTMNKSDLKIASDLSVELEHVRNINSEYLKLLKILGLKILCPR